MKHHLAIGAHQLAPQQYLVRWATNECYGQFRVGIGLPESRDDEVIVQLHALHRLLVEVQVCGDEVAGGAITLETSSGAIKKLALKKSAKRHLFHHGAWLNPRFSQASFKVNKRPALLEASRAPQPRQWVSVPDVQVCNTQALMDGFSDPRLGSVEVTDHAVARFCERSGVGEKSQAWSRIKALVHNGLSPAPVPEKVLFQKRRKHGQNVGHLMNAGDDWQVVLVEAGQETDPRGRRWRLVTLYRQRRLSRAG